MVRQRLDEMQAGLDRLNYKIEHYNDIMLKAERGLYDEGEGAQQ